MICGFDNTPGYEISLNNGPSIFIIYLVPAVILLLLLLLSLLCKTLFITQTVNNCEKQQRNQGPSL